MEPNDHLADASKGSGGVADDLALIEPLEGLYVGQLTIAELEALSRLVRAGFADRDYGGVGGFLGMAKVRIVRPAASPERTAE